MQTGDGAGDRGRRAGARLFYASSPRRQKRLGSAVLLLFFSSEERDAEVGQRRSRGGGMGREPRRPPPPPPPATTAEEELQCGALWSTCAAAAPAITGDASARYNRRGGGVRGKIPIFFLFFLRDDDDDGAATPGSPLPPPSHPPRFLPPPPRRADGGGVCSLSAPFSKAPLSPARFILLPPSSRLMLHSHLRQNNTARAGRKRLFWIKRQPCHCFFLSLRTFIFITTGENFFFIIYRVLFMHYKL